MRADRSTSWFCLSCSVSTVVLLSAQSRGGSVDFEGSSVVSFDSCCAPDVVYKKFPSDVAVGPNDTWQLGVGFTMESSPTGIEVSLRLNPADPHPDIQLTGDTALFVEQDGLYHNYDSLERFEIVYTGQEAAFVGPVDFLIEPDGMSPIPLRIHLVVIERTGFPISLNPGFAASCAIGDITGNGTLEVLMSGRIGADQGVYAFNHVGTPMAGWPFRSEEPGVIDQNYSAPTGDITKSCGW